MRTAADHPIEKLLRVRDRVAKSELGEQVTHARWQPIPPPRRGLEDRRDFHISMLIPGFSNAFHRVVLGRGYTAVRAYRAEAAAAADADPELMAMADAACSAFTPADGMLMAQLRGRCQLPFWSRLAIVEYRKRGYSIPAIADAFRCSLRTVVNAIGRGMFFSPHRRLTRFQLNPPSKIPRKPRQ